MRAFTRVAAAMFLTAGAAGCKFPYPADVLEEDAATPPGHAVGGTVTGLWTGAGVTLHLAAEGVDEDLAIRAGEPFVFANRLEDGATYTVTIANDGDDHDCQLGNGSGRIDGADVDDLAVTCTNLVPHGITISTPVTFTFDPRTTRYPLDVSILQQEVSVTVTGTTLTSVKVSDTPVPLGQPSAPVPLGQGSTSVFIDVAKGPISQRYELAFNRGAAPIVEALRTEGRNGGFYGLSVAADADWVAIGHPNNCASDENNNDIDLCGSGAVMIYRRNAQTWSYVQTLKGSAVTRSRSFGASVSLDGDTLVVGANNDDEGATDAGAVYVFRRSSQTDRWIEEQRITAPDPHTADRFGTLVAIDGDVFVASAPYHDHGGAFGNNYGQIYTFIRSGTTWSPGPTLRIPSPTQADNLGYFALAFDSDRLVTRRETSGTSLVAFQWTGSAWMAETIQPLRTAAAVAIDGDLMVAGNNYDAPGGALYFYGRSADGWTGVSTARAAMPLVGSEIGASVAVHDNIAVTGGSAGLHAFERVGGSWTPTPVVTASTAAGDFVFGHGIAVSGNGAFVGSPREGDGKVWFFR